jgi:hypothetical protein
MATLAIGLAGAGLGSFFGVPALGFTLGNLAANLLFAKAGAQPESPRLEDLSVSSSALGAPIPSGWGRWTYAGNMIWGLRIREEETEEDVGKGGNNTVSVYNYSATFSMAFCAGPADGSGAKIRRIWADAKLIADYSNQAGPELQPTYIIRYDGAETQSPSPLQEADRGIGNVPAYRGTVLAEFDDMPINEFGRRPSIRAEIVFDELVENDFKVEPPWPARPATNEQIWVFSTESTVAFGKYPASGAFPSFQAARTVWDLAGVLLDNTPVTYNVPNPGTSAQQVYGPVRNTGIDVTEVAVGTARDTGNTPRLCWYQNLTALPDSGPPGGGALRDDTGTPLAIGPIYGKSVWDPNREIIFMHGGGDAGDRNAHLYDCPVVGNIITLTTLARTRYDPGATFSVHDIFPAQNSVYALTYNVAAQRIVELDPFTTPPTVAATWDVSYLGGGYAGLIVDESFSPRRAIVCTGTNSTYSVYELLDGGGTPTLLETGSAFDSTGATGEPAVVLPNLIHQKQQFLRTGAVTDGPARLADVIADTCARVNLGPADVDVSGVVEEVPGVALSRQASARQFLDPLLEAFSIDVTESNHTLVFRSRANAPAAVEIPDDELGAAVVAPGRGMSSASGTGGALDLPGAVGDLIRYRRAQNDELPRSVSIRYRNSDRDHESNAQRFAVLGARSQSDHVQEVSVAMTDAEAAAMSERRAMLMWTERDGARIAVSAKYLALDPGDVVSVGGRTWRIAAIAADLVALHFKYELLAHDPDVLTTSTPGTSDPNPPTNTPPVTGPTTLGLLDIPILRDEDIPQEVGFYFAMSGITADWPGATLLRSLDEGTTWQKVGSRASNSVRGTAQTVLADGPAGFDWNQTDWTGDPNQPWDTVSTVDVLLGSIGTLSNASRAEILAGANSALLGQELIGFETAADQGGGVWRLSGLLRGRRGTEAARLTHALSEEFVLVSVLATGRVTTGTDDMTRTRRYRAPTFGDELTTAPTQDFANTGISLRPFSVVGLSATRPPVGTGWAVTLGWTRRSRYGEPYRDFVADPPPLDAPAEQYDIEIWDSGFATLKRIETTVVATFVYSEAAQNTDFGSAGQAFGARVYQVNTTFPAERGTAQRLDFPGFSDGGPTDPTLEPIPNIGYTVIAGETLAAGQFVNLYNDNGTRARHADRTLNQRAHGWATTAAAAGAPVTVAQGGLNEAVAAVAGTEYWLGLAGAASASRPTSAGELEQRLGIGLDTGIDVDLGPVTVKSA